MNQLSKSLIDFFPELNTFKFERDEELPYIMIDHLINFLLQESRPHFKPELLNRLAEFHNWCLEQPRGDVASNDVLTIITVGFYEKLIENEPLQCLIPKLIPKEDFLKNEKYWIQWSNKELFDKVAQLY